MNQRFFVTSTGTGIGKTFITAALVRQARARGQRVMACKPIISGFTEETVSESDTGLLLESLGLPATAANIDRISPWRFAAPLAPSMAARHEGRGINFDALLAQNRAAIAGPDDLVVIEGVGGVMVPLDDHHTVIDWIAALGIPVLLVAGSYLGTISHTLTALDALQCRKITVHKVIVNETEQSSVDLAATADELRHWTQASVVTVNRNSSEPTESILSFR